MSTKLIRNPLLKKGFQYVTVLTETNYPEVATYADLPTASTVTGKIYFVQTQSGSLFTFNRKDPGLYRSNGTTWITANIPSYFSTGEFRIQDSVDQTKQLAFDVSGITTGTTRTLIVGNAGTIAVTSDITTAISAKNTFLDGSFRIQNTTDPTKQLAFSLTGITTGTSRTITVPNYDGTLATLTGTESLTNKTYSGVTLTLSSTTAGTVSTGSIITPGGISVAANAWFGGNVGIGVGSNAALCRLEAMGGGTSLSGTGFFNLAALQDHTNYRGFLMGYDTSGQIGVIMSGAPSSATKSSTAFWGSNGSAYTEMMRLTGDGNLAIGTASASAMLHLKAAAVTAGFRIDFTSGSLDAFQYFNGATKLTYIDSVGRIIVTDTTLATSSAGAIITNGGVSSLNHYIGGNISSAAWTTSGLGFVVGAVTYTDSSSATGTTALQYAHKIGAPTFAASNTGVIYTTAVTLYIDPPAAGTNVTNTTTAALMLGGSLLFRNITPNIGTIDNFGLTFKANNITRYTISSGGIHNWNSAASSSGTPSPVATFTAPANTSITTNTEAVDINFDLSGINKMIDGTVPLQRTFRIQGRTYTPQTSILTLTSVATLDVGAPIAGSGTTFGNSYGIRTGGRLGMLAGLSTIYGAAGGTIFDYNTDAGSTSTTETDLYSSSIPASTLGSNKDKIDAEYVVQLVNSVSTKQIRAYFAGTLIFDTGALSISASTDFLLDITIIRVSATVVRCGVKATTTGATINAYAKYTEITGLTLMNANILKITGTSAGASVANNDIVARCGFVEWKPAV